MIGDKQSKQPSPDSLDSLVTVERMKGREPQMTTMLAILDRLLKGEKSDGALQMLAENGLPAMMFDAHDAGLLSPAHWEVWKARVGMVEAEMVLATKDSIVWPNEIREWAAVVAVSAS
jgi:hypothetical protein